MSQNDHIHLCPVEHAATLDNRFRRWVQNPRKILSPYLKEGMKVLEVGCGPGFFTLDIAELIGKSGKVYAVDLQEGMLQKVRIKIQGTELERRITLHLSEENIIGVTEKVDFVLMFYVVHEIPDKKALFEETGMLLDQDGKVLIVEPPFHVSKRAFAETIEIAEEAGLSVIARPKMYLSKAIVMKKQAD